MGVGFAGAFIGMGGPSFERVGDALASGGIIMTLVAVFCVTIIVAFVLELLQTFADRACMLEDTNVFESYG